MTLVDTSIWIEFFRARPAAARLSALLDAGEVLVHPWVLGELVLGRPGGRWAGTVADLKQLPRPSVVPDGEVLAFIERRGLAGKGIGWVDAHLLAAALTAGATLWTADQRLQRAANAAGVDHL